MRGQKKLASLFINKEIAMRNSMLISMLLFMACSDAYADPGKKVNVNGKIYFHLNHLLPAMRAAKIILAPLIIFIGE